MRSTVWSRNTQWTSLWWRKSRGSERRTVGWRPTTDSPIQSCSTVLPSVEPLIPDCVLLQQGYVYLPHDHGMWFESVDGRLSTWGQKVFSQNRAEVENTAFLSPSLLPEEDEQRAALFSPSLPPSVRLEAEHQQCLLLLTTTTAASQIWVKLCVL